MNSQKQSAGRQGGGTLLGLIIGLIVGLAIAVVVALVITKGATPFTNKGGKQEKAAEPTAGQVADPNKPLYGNKDAAKEAAKDFVKEPEINTQTADSKADLKALKKPDVKPETSDTKTLKPGEAKDISKDAVAKPDAADDKAIYYLQAGAFKDQSDAENIRAKLALLGVEARVSDRTSDTGVLYRVRIGPFNQVDAMNKVRNKLSENGMDVAVVRNLK